MRAAVISLLPVLAWVASAQPSSYGYGGGAYGNWTDANGLPAFVVSDAQPLSTAAIPVAFHQVALRSCLQAAGRNFILIA